MLWKQNNSNLVKPRHVEVYNRIIMKFVQKEALVPWGSLLAVVLFIYYQFSSGQFSFIFTLAGTVQTFGFALIVLKIRKSRSVAGLSRETFFCYALVFALRSLLFQFYKGYLPNDQTGNLIFKIQEVLATGLSVYVLYAIMVAFKSSYNQDLDTVKCYYLIALAAVLALLFHSSLNRSFIGDYTWAFTQYLETFAIFSQFVLFRNKKGDIESYTSHFVAAQAISRVLFIIFWVFTYAELNTDSAMSLLSQYVGYWFMISQIIHLVIMADFMYYYAKALMHGSDTIQLPTYI